MRYRGHIQTAVAANALVAPVERAAAMAWLQNLCDQLNRDSGTITVKIANLNARRAADRFRQQIRPGW